VLVVDDGAREALEKKGRSLLPIGIQSVSGEFEPGAVVIIRALDGADIAHGLTDYSSTELALIKGKRSAELPADAGEVIHRDNMVFVSKSSGDRGAGTG
jgi:glutamate 5-kinase